MAETRCTTNAAPERLNAKYTQDQATQTSSRTPHGFTSVLGQPDLHPV